MKDITVYGISNCDSTKKTLDWLKKNNIAFTFHDFNKLGITAKKIREWIRKSGVETVMNKRSTTWRELVPEVRIMADDEEEAIRIMQEYTSIVKRPIIEYGKKIIVGYEEKAFAALTLQKM